MSKFWQRKIETGFSRIDMDHDGFITVKDFEVLADKLIDSRHLDLERGTKLRSALTEIWDKFYKDMAKGKPIDKHAYVECTKRLINGESLNSLTKTVFHMWFASIDANADGIIQVEEYIEFFEILGLDSDLARSSFQCMDTDHDGFLSLQEYVDAGIDYVTNEDETGMNPGKCFWGPLL